MKINRLFLICLLLGTTPSLVLADVSAPVNLPMTITCTKDSPSSCDLNNPYFTITYFPGSGTYHFKSANYKVDWMSQRLQYTYANDYGSHNDLDNIVLEPAYSTLRADVDSASTKWQEYSNEKGHYYCEEKDPNLCLARGFPYIKNFHNTEKAGQPYASPVLVTNNTPYELNITTSLLNDAPIHITNNIVKPYTQSVTIGNSAALDYNNLLAFNLKIGQGEQSYRNTQLIFTVNNALTPSYYAFEIASPNIVIDQHEICVNAGHDANFTNVDITVSLKLSAGDC